MEKLIRPNRCDIDPNQELTPEQDTMYRSLHAKRGSKQVLPAQLKLGQVPGLIELIYKQQCDEYEAATGTQKVFAEEDNARYIANTIEPLVENKEVKFRYGEEILSYDPMTFVVEDWRKANLPQPIVRTRWLKIRTSFVVFLLKAVTKIGKFLKVF